MKTKKYILLITLLIVIIGLGAGAVVFANDGFTVGNAFQLGKKAAENAESDGKNKIAAKVGDIEIYEYNIDNVMMANEYQMKMSEQKIAEVSDSESAASYKQSVEEYKKLNEKQLREKALDTIVMNKLKYLKCEQLGIYPTEEEARNMWETTQRTLKEALESDNEISREKAAEAFNTMKENQNGLGMSDEEYLRHLIESYREILCSNRLREYYTNNVSYDEYETYDAYLESLKKEFEVIYY